MGRIQKRQRIKHKISKEKMLWECERSWAQLRRSAIFLLLGLQAAACLFVSAKGAGKIYLEMLPTLMLISLGACFFTYLIQGNQKILLYALFLLTVGTMLQSIFKEEYRIKHPEQCENISLSAGLQKQYIIAFVVALVISFLFWNFQEISSIRMAEMLTLLSFGISIGTLLFAKSVGNVKNWISIGGFSLQTTEVVKLLYVFIAATLLGTVEHPDKKRILAFYAISWIEMGFLTLQSEFGTLLLILMLFFTFLFLFVPDLRIFLGTVLGVGGIGAVVIFLGKQLNTLAKAGHFLGTNPIAAFYLSNFQKIANRFIYWMNPEMDALGQGYQLLKAKESIVLGGWFGTSSVTNLPVKTSDLVYPALIQRCGMLFALLVFLIFIFLWMEGMQVCVRKQEKYHKMMAVGLISMFIDQSILIIAGSTGLCPLTGITLPFISSGGTSLVISFVLIGVLLCISGNIPWKGQKSEEIEFFKKGTDCAKRVIGVGDRHVRRIIQNVRARAGALRGSRSDKGGGQTGGV